MAKHMFWIVLLLTTGCAQHRMYLLPGDLSSKSNKEILEIQKFFSSKPGTFHALPRTVAKATVALTRIERSLTDTLSQLDDKQRQLVFDTLELKQLTKGKTEVSYSLSTVQMELSDVPDLKAIVFTELIGKVNQNNEFTAKYDEDGTPQSFLSESTDVTLEQVAELLGVVGRVAASVGFAGPEAIAVLPVEVIQIIEATLEIRTARLKLMSSEMVSDLDVLKRQFLELDKKELELLSKLIKTKTDIWMPRFVLDPAEATKDRLLILSIYPKGGVVVAPGRNPIPRIPPSWKPKTKTDVKLLELCVFPPQGATLASEAELAKPQQPKSPASWKKAWGLIYRIPESVSLQLALGEQERAFVEGHIAQLGNIRFLPKHFNTSASTIDAELYPRSGALKKLRMKAQAISPSTIKSVGAGFEAVATAYGADRAAAAKAKAEREAAAMGFAQAVVTTTLGALLK